MSEAPPYSAARVEVVRLPGAVRERDAVAVEEPLEIRINGEPVAVTMRTPGHDEELALGFCFTEGLAPRTAAPPADLAANTVEVVADGMPTARNFYTSSSCGVCGKGALEAVAVEAPPVGSAVPPTAAVVSAPPGKVRGAPASPPSRGASGTDGRAARRRREQALRLAEGARAPRRRDARRPGVAHARGGMRRTACGRQGVGPARAAVRAGRRRNGRPRAHRRRRRRLARGEARCLRLRACRLPVRLAEVAAETRRARAGASADRPPAGGVSAITALRARAQARTRRLLAARARGEGRRARRAPARQRQHADRPTPRSDALRRTT